MEESILKSTKKILGLDENYTPFDLDVITHINAAFSILDQLGVGPDGGFMIEDDATVWGDYEAPPNQLHLTKTYVFLKVRLLFDPPTTSFLIEAMNNQIKEYEWRLNTFREWALDPTDPMDQPDFIVEPIFGDGEGELVYESKRRRVYRAPRR
jgi:hypothetical protein